MAFEAKRSYLPAPFLPKVLFIRPNAAGGLNHYSQVMEFGSFGSLSSVVLFITSSSMTLGTLHNPAHPWVWAIHLRDVPYTGQQLSGKDNTGLHL